MIETIEPFLEVEYIAPAVVMVGILLRLWLGDVIFHPRYTPVWNTLRRSLIPLLSLAGRLPQVPDLPAIENRADPDEYIGVVDDHSPKEIAKAVRSYYDIEIPLLAGYKTFLDHYRESSTWVRYHGPKPFGAAPDWLKPYQTHVTTFTIPDEGEAVTAHYEANSYRPDLWRDHLFKGESWDISRGREEAKAMLEEAGVDWEVVDVKPEGGN